jgi:hypothetical protein
LVSARRAAFSTARVIIASVSLRMISAPTTIPAIVAVPVIKAPACWRKNPPIPPPAASVSTGFVAASGASRTCRWCSVSCATTKILIAQRECLSDGPFVKACPLRSSIVDGGSVPPFLAEQASPAAPAGSTSSRSMTRSPALESS